MAAGRVEGVLRADFDYATVSEHWDTPANAEQREMASLRYSLAARAAHDRRYLEVGCGPGIGLAIAEGAADLVAGGDISRANLLEARTHGPDWRLAQFDSARLPFRSSSFDVVACLEAIYYFPNQDRFLAEARRLLRPNGQLVICFANSLRPGFTPSPGAVSYPTLAHLRSTLSDLGLRVECYGAFPWQPVGAVSAALETARRLASRAGLIPKSLAGRARVKALLYRDMRPISEVRMSSPDAKLVALPGDDTGQGFKVLFVVASCT